MKKCYNCAEEIKDDALKCRYCGEVFASKSSADALLAEYHATQASAEHHDNLVWTATSILWAGSLVLLGLVVQNINSVNSKIVLTVLSALGIIVNVGAWIVCNGLRDVKRQKYEHCKELEAALSLTQHSGLPYNPCSQDRIFTIGMIIFVLVWVFVIIRIWVIFI